MNLLFALKLFDHLNWWTRFCPSMVLVLSIARNLTSMWWTALAFLCLNALPMTILVMGLWICRWLCQGVAHWQPGFHHYLNRCKACGWYAAVKTSRNFYGCNDHLLALTCQFLSSRVDLFFGDQSELMSEISTVNTQHGHGLVLRTKLRYLGWIQQ